MVEFSRYQEAANLLKRSRAPLFVVLESVDADALGATIAMARALAEENVSATVYCKEQIPDYLTFIYTDFFIEHNSENLKWSDYDLVVVSDSGSLARTGLSSEIKKFYDNDGAVLNIDHHHVHETFGTVNLIDAKASAAAELVYDVLKLGGWAITPEIATAILAGLIADTGNFTNAATTIHSLTIAAECYAKGANARRILAELYRNKPVEALQFWGEILSRLERNEKWGIVATVILQEDFDKYQVDETATEGIANFMNFITNMNAALVLSETTDGKIHGSLRTTKDKYDVSKLAVYLGGGGHKKAAGFTVPGKIVRTERGWRVE